MSSEACVQALNCAIKEIKNAYPTVQQAFIYNPDTHLIAKDDEIEEGTANEAIEAVHSLNTQSQSFGELRSVTFRGTKTKASIKYINKLCVITVSENGTDEKALATLTQVMIPTAIKIVDILYPDCTLDDKEETKTDSIPITEIEESISNQEEPLASESDSKMPTKPTKYPMQDPVLDPVPPIAPVNQLIIENLSGFGNMLRFQDTVRIDSSVIAHWNEIYGYDQIEEVDIQETQTGKRVRCRFKPLKNLKSESHGIIQMSEKIQQLLETSKGALVTVKPAIR